MRYRWLDLETDDATRRLAERLEPGAAHRPLVVFPDGGHLAEPTRAELAAHRVADARRAAPATTCWWSAVGRPAWLPASTARRAVAQARRFGAEVLAPRRSARSRKRRYRVLELADDSELTSQAPLIATGVAYRQLQLPNAEQRSGAGLYYGSATTEALALRASDVYILGGANSAGQAAVYLSRYARSVTRLVRRCSLSASMSRYLIDQIAETSNIQVRPCMQVIALHGVMRLAAISVLDVDSDNSETLQTPTLFVLIGAQPNTDWLGGVVQRDPHRFILTGPETSTPGIFAAGAVRHGSVKRVASGVGDGGMAVSFIHQYLIQM